MAARKPLPEKEAPDALIIPKSDFIEKLSKRIVVGKELFDRSVTNVEELKENETEFYRWDSYNSEFLKSAFNNENNAYRTQYNRVNWSILGGGGNSPSEQLKELKKDIKNKVNYLDELIEKTELLKSEVEQQKIVTQVNPSFSGPEIFIVHGHNRDILQTVARSIEKLSLKPIILNEQANGGLTLIEKFEQHSDVGFAIILLTDDDEGKAKTTMKLESRARQNVILELGYFIGKLGRSRVLPLYSEGVELPSDIHGLVYIPLDKSENWKFSIVKELKAAGYTVDANNLL